MFTGLVEEVGRIVTVNPRGDGATIAVEADTVLDATTRLGDSIAIEGACQTVVAMNGRQFTVEAIRETLHRTRLGDLRGGDPVNLERAMRPSDRLGGHLVQGHVDGMVTALKTTALAGSWRLRLSLPADGKDFVVEKGSICLNGVSLTVASRGDDWFETEIIPHTWDHTTLHRLKAGDKVHVEWDLIAKYVQNMLGPHLGGGGLTLDRLRDAGF